MSERKETMERYRKIVRCYFGLVPGREHDFVCAVEDKMLNGDCVHTATLATMTGRDPRVAQDPEPGCGCKRRGVK